MIYEFAYSNHNDRTTGLPCHQSNRIVPSNACVTSFGRCDKATCVSCGKSVELFDVAVELTAQPGQLVVDPRFVYSSRGELCEIVSG